MSIGTFGSFTQARLAIYAAQTGINVSGNNISNINTEGYTRQKVDQQSLYNKGTDRYYSRYDVRTGLGVLCTGVSQLRDPYLDIRYRNEMSDVGESDSKLQGLQQIQSILDEVGDGEITEGEDFGLIAAYFGEIYDSLSKLVGQTAHHEYDIQARTNCDTLAKQFNAYANKLEQLHTNIVSQYETQVTAVNGLLTEIRDLSEQIRKSDIYGDKALEMRDLRNLKIDQLSEYMKIKEEYNTEDIGAGQSVEKLIIRMGNANPDIAVDSDETVLIDGIYGAQISILPKENPDYDKDADPAAAGVTVPDPADPAHSKYFKYLDPDGNRTNVASEAAHNDNFDMAVSELRDARGTLHYTSKTKTAAATQADYEKYQNDIKDPTLKKNYTKTDPDTGAVTVTSYYKKGADYFKQTYTRTPSTETKLDDNDIHGRLQAQRELLTEAGEFTDKDIIDGKNGLSSDELAATKRGLPYYQHILDLLANQFATVMNAANRGYLTNPDGEYIDEDGKVIQLDGESIVSGKELTDGQKAALGTQTLEEYLKANKAIFKGGNLFSNGGESNDDKDPAITAANISVSLDWSTGAIQIQNSYICPPSAEGADTYLTTPAATDSTNILHIQAAFNTKREFRPDTLLGGNVDHEPMFRGTFEEMWVQVGATLGEDQNIISTELDSSYEAATEIASSKDSVSGVDFNDEAMNLMMYAKSYNAACRLMTTIDSVLDKLINNTGLTT